MNKRIKELLEQSGLQPYYDAQEGQIEKFAQLIVRECAWAADFADKNPGDYVLKRFGVEE